MDLVVRYLDKNTLTKMCDDSLLKNMLSGPVQDLIGPPSSFEVTNFGEETIELCNLSQQRELSSADQVYDGLCHASIEVDVLRSRSL